MANPIYLFRYNRDFPGSPVVKTSPFSAERAVQYQVRELRSHKFLSQRKKRKKKSKHKTEATVTNSIKTLKMVHIKKKL